MKKRIRTIFLLMTLCILGINGFQGYWLYTTWQITTQQFAHTAREALFAVLQKQQMATARTFFNEEVKGKPQRVFFQQFRRETPDSNRIIVVAGSPALKPGQRYQVSEQTENLVVTATTRQRRGKLAADTLARSISKILLNDWSAAHQPVKLRQLADAYHRELRLHDADAPFQLDTVVIHSESPKPGMRLMRFNGETAMQPGGAFRTPPVPLNPLRDLYVRASFPAPTFYVLRRMGGLLGGSVGLLGLTTGCFLLMLSTILRQKKLSEIKNDFINNMTHELKTPIATVSAAVEAMQHYGALQDPQKTQTYLAISRQELQRLSDLVEKVLQMATEERRELAIQPEIIKPAEIISELIARHQLKATKPVQIDVAVSADETVRADAMHLTNVINNLLDNAIKYSGEQVSIKIRSQRAADGWRLTVADDGPGIPKNYQEAIFDRFFRVPTGNLHPVKGFGLGLFYARQVVERHGGTLSVRSEPGQGSEFAIWLPG